MIYPHLIAGDHVSDVIGLGHQWDGHVLDALLPYLTDTVVDIGANVGGLALPFAQRAKKVVCFEPDEAMCVALAANAEANGLRNVTIVREGAYSRDTYLQPNIIEGQHPSTWTWLPAVRGVHAAPARWEGMDKDHVSAIKVDAQGADLHVLNGLSRIVDRDHPAIVFEWEKDLAYLHGHEWRDYVLWLVRHGYKVHQLEPHPDYLAVPNGR